MNLGFETGAWWFHRLRGVSAAAMVAFVCSAPPSLGATVTSAVASDDDVEIVVTANRREQKLQDVPIAVSAITGDSARAAGVTGTSTLQSVVPNLSITRVTNSATPFLRGLGSSSGAPNSENSVALYVDGVYMPSANANFFEFNNIERIEVLKGPQGTLFGRNSSGGVIHIITKDPRETPEARIELGYANFNTISGDAYVAGPIAPEIVGNLAVMYSNQVEGWGKNIFSGEDTPGTRDVGVRGKLVWSFGNSTTAKLAVDYSRSQNGAINGQNPPGTTNLNFPVILATGRGNPTPGDYNVNDNFTQRSDITARGASLSVDFDVGATLLKSISAYRKTSGYWTYDQDLSPWPGVNAKIDQSSTMFTQEVHWLSRAEGRFQWLLGAFYYNYKAGNAPEELTGFLLAPNFPGCLAAGSCNANGGFDLSDNTRSASTAVFGQASFPLFERTNFTVGGRYSWDRVDFTGTTYVHGTNVIVPGIGGPAGATVSDNEPTYRISLDHKFTPDLMGFVSYNRGIKAAGFDLSAIAMAVNAANPFKSEHLDAYEIGMKSELLNRRIRFNAGAFYYDFKNFQFQKVVAGSGVTFNGPGSTMYGAEFDVVAEASDHLLINSSVGLLHTQIADFPGAPNTCRNFATGLNDRGGFFCNPLTGVATTIPFNASGNNTAHSPAFTANLGFVYTFRTGTGRFDFSTNAYHSAKSYFEIDNRTKNDPYTLLNASVLWTDPKDAITVRIWGKNLTKAYYYTQYSGQGGASDVASPAAPAQYGITLGYRF